MKYTVTLNAFGKPHLASIDANINGEALSGTLTTAEYGTGYITRGIANGNNLSGSITLDGYDADFKATLDGDKITGSISYGWFFNASFEGTVSA